MKDNELHRTHWTEYDQAQRPIQASIRDDLTGDLLYRTTLAYNKVNNLIRFQEQAGSAKYRTEYNYDKDDRTTKMGYQSGSEIRGVEYVYDKVNRVGSVKRGTATITKVSSKKDRTIAVSENTALGTTFTYVPGDTNYGAQATTPLVSGMVTGTGSNAMSFAYTYDDLGNILSETRNGLTTTYVYDHLGQLIRVNDLHENVSWVYTYDRGGNILSKGKYAYTTGTLGTALQTIPYSYGDANWKDKLTSYDGKAITYDAIGNPLTYDGWTYTWIAGRKLAGMVKSGTNASFKYDANGLRIQKTVNGVVTDYTLHGKLVTGLKQGSNIMHFFYSQDSRPELVDFGGSLYWYVHNLQGDIVAIVDNTGTKVVEYKYDAWGKPIGAPWTLTTAYEALAHLNPFRYRGYVYDEETGLYYLRSRYHDPVWGRFLIIDSQITARNRLLNANVFIYCINNPICLLDYGGNAYESAKAMSYARMWWNSNNPKFSELGSDCANFISQCLDYGGLSRHLHNFLSWRSYWIPFKGNRGTKNG